MRANKVAVERGRFTTCSGSSVKPVYTPCLQSDGSIVLEATGEYDMQPEIDAYAATCSMEALLTRFANGDVSALNKYQPMYLDLTEMPSTYAEALQHLINAEHAFDHLPVDIKQRYGNNWRNWISAAGSEDWLKELGLLSDPVDLKPIENPGIKSEDDKDES